MSAMFMAMVLTGAGGLAEAQPPMPVPAPPVPVPYIVAPTPAVPMARPPRAMTPHVIDYFSPDDYPAGALRPDQAGLVSFLLGIGPDGRVRRCTITASSGSSALDAATCRVLIERARYSPAVDGAGRPVESVVSGGVVWAAPGGPGAPARILRPPTTPMFPMAPPPPPRIIPPQRARANLNSYFSADDYPAAALRANHVGTTGFRLTIGANGRVVACDVTASSGSQPLDAATCRILRSRARYTPARDLDGNPTTGSDSGRVTWALPDEPIDRAGLAMAYIPAQPSPSVPGDMNAADIPPGAPAPRGAGISAMRVAIGRDGQVIGCDIMTSSGAAALDAAACRLYAARARYVPGRNEKGEAVCDVVWTEARWNPAFAGRPPDPPGTRPPPPRLPRPLREQLNAQLCPGWPVAERPLVPVPSVSSAYGYPILSPPPAPARPRPFPERVRGNFNSYFSVDDYPPEALRARAQGVVTVRLVVGADGWVSDCSLVVSSGSPALDTATCRILQRRARYFPALRSDGPAGTDVVRITWTLPAD